MPSRKAGSVMGLDLEAELAAHDAEILRIGSTIHKALDVWRLQGLLDGIELAELTSAAAIQEQKARREAADRDMHQRLQGLLDMFRRAAEWRGKIAATIALSAPPEPAEPDALPARAEVH